MLGTVPPCLAIPMASTVLVDLVPPIALGVLLAVAFWQPSGPVEAGVALAAAGCCVVTAASSRGSDTITGHWQRVSETGRDLSKDPNAVTKVWAADRLAGDLDPLLVSSRSNFALGDYETASFAAMKAVEVEVRRVAGLPNEMLGVALMRKAFGPKDGALRDPDAEGGERQATADLFAGAIGAYKNPASHRTVQFEDSIEAAETIQLADLLLRIVHRAEMRLKRAL